MDVGVKLVLRDIIKLDLRRGQDLLCGVVLLRISTSTTTDIVGLLLLSLLNLLLVGTAEPGYRRLRSAVHVVKHTGAHGVAVVPAGWPLNGR